MMYVSFLCFTSRVRRVGGSTCYGSTGSTGSTGLFCFTHPPSSETKHSPQRGIVRSMQTSLGNATMSFLGSCNPSHNWWEMSTSNPPICVERKWMERESPNFVQWIHVLWCLQFYDVLDLWCVFSETSTCASTNNVRRRRMAYKYEIHIFIYNICIHTGGEEWIRLKTAPKRMLVFCVCVYAYVLSSSCLLALYVFQTTLSWACARCLTHLAGQLPNCWCVALVLKDPSNYKFCVSLLMLVYSMKESEGMSGFQNLPGVESYSPSMFGHVSKMRRL